MKKKAGVFLEKDMVFLGMNSRYMLSLVELKFETPWTNFKSFYCFSI